MDTEKLTIKDVTEGLASKEFTAVEIAEQFLDVIKKKDKDLNAFITTTPEFALEEAQSIDEKIAKNETVGELAGVPIAIKHSIVSCKVCRGLGRINNIIDSHGLLDSG